ncbi:hypothetical protein ACWNXI_06950 [Caldibacillus thermoamylovorans]
MKNFAEGAPLFVGLGHIGGRRLVDRAEGCTARRGSWQYRRFADHAEVAICGSFQRTRLGLWRLYEAVNAARLSMG